MTGPEGKLRTRTLGVLKGNPGQVDEVDFGDGRKLTCIYDGNGQALFPDSFNRPQDKSALTMGVSFSSALTGSMVTLFGVIYSGKGPLSALIVIAILAVAFGLVDVALIWKLSPPVIKEVPVPLGVS